MSPVDQRLVRIAAEARRDWQAVCTHLERALATDPGQGPMHAAYVALSMDHAYQAFETLLLRIERECGLPPRMGADWHAQLLDDAALDLGPVRPPLVPAAAVADWARVLRFRHFLRHAYAVELDAELLRGNVARLAAAVEVSAPIMTALLQPILLQPMHLTGDD